MRTLCATSIVLMLLAVSAPGGAAPIPQNDAGTGGDAPGVRQGAIPVLPGDAFLGFLNPPLDPSDFYAFDAAGPGPMRVRSEGTVQSCLNIRSDTTLLRATCSTHLIGTIDTEVAIPRAGHYYIEFRTFQATTDYWISFTLDSTRPPSPAAEEGPASLPQDDAGSGADAPDSVYGAPVVAPGVVHEGAITQPNGPYFVADAADVFAFDASEGQAVDVRLAGTGLGCIDPTGPTGAPIPGGCATGALEAHFAFLAEETGRHHFTLTSNGPQSYRFSFALDAASPILSELSEPGMATPARLGAPPGSDVGANAVLALIDDGINPYHLAFRDSSPRAFQHPSTYLVGFPADAVALNLTFGIADLGDAVEADCAEWEKVEVGKLYWIPGTRIVGAITFPTHFTEPDTLLPYQHGSITCASPSLKGYGNLVGSGGHGTMTSSRAAGKGYGACPECLIVMVQGFGAEHVRWAAEQPWIDAQSNSWGPVFAAYTPTETGGVATGTPQLARAAEEAAQKQLSFWAAGNGILFRYGVLGHPTQLGSHFGPSMIRVGATDSGRVATWGGLTPHVASDGCNSWAAVFSSNTDSGATVGSGTSAATPFVAGTTARVIREARAALGDLGTTARPAGVLAQGAPIGDGPLADGLLTMAEVKRAVFATADPRPAATPEDSTTCDITSLYGPVPVGWTSVPAGAAQMPLIGYGAVTRRTGDAAIATLVGEAQTPERPVEDAFFAADDDARAVTYAAWSAPAV